MAGGVPADAYMPGDTEDDESAAAIAAKTISAGDIVIAVTASGSTPYPLALAQTARACGASVIGIANNPDAALFKLSDIAIHLATPPELVAGSTRLGAATAQKVALNMMSTLMGIRLGQVHDGMMVGLIADNAKLRARAAATVARIADTTPARAADSLARAAGAVKPAVLIALGMPPDMATALLGEADGNLRTAIARLNETGEQHRK
jgi:N-acetylmuramic acid 6-phosphate etherase